MATLTRPKDSAVNHGFQYVPTNIASGIPKPFPTPAEREEEELLDTLASEELCLVEDGGLSVGKDAPDDQLTPRDFIASVSSCYHGRQKSEVYIVRQEDLLPSRIGQVQSTCITALHNLLVVSSRALRSVPDRRHSMPASPISQPIFELHALVNDLRAQQADGAMTERPTAHSENELLAEIRSGVDHLTGDLSPRDAELARTLVSLLVHFSRLCPTSSRTTEPSSPRAASWNTVTGSPDPYSTLRRHVSDFQLERSTSQDGATSRSTPAQAIQRALLWSEIDSELEAVLDLCRSHSLDDPFGDDLPPGYDPADYVGSEHDSLPQYEPLHDETEADSKGSYKAGVALHGTSSRLHDGANEKMKLDLEAVTRAIDHLYSVAPQLHNQRVELNKSKLEEMEKATRKGKQRATDGDMDKRELEKMLELISRATERKLSKQAVFIDESLKRKMELIAREKDQEKVSLLFSHFPCYPMSCENLSSPVWNSVPCS